MSYTCIFWNCGGFFKYGVICIFMLEHLTRIFNLSTISSFETRTVNYSTRVYWHQIGCEIANYGWECRICRGEHGQTGCIKISSLRPRTASNAVSNLRSGYGVASDTHVSMGWRFRVLSLYGLFRSPCSASRYYNERIGVSCRIVTYLFSSKRKSHLFVHVALASARSDKTQLLYHFFHIALINQQWTVVFCLTYTRKNYIEKNKKWNNKFYSGIC